MTDRELMQWALDALDGYARNCKCEGGGGTTDAAEALRARLAQPEQEPVAWITGGGKGELWWHQSVKFDDDGNLIGENPDDIPLYTAPPQREWQGLTKGDADAAYKEMELNYNYVDFARAIEAKLKERNT